MRAQLSNIDHGQITCQSMLPKLPKLASPQAGPPMIYSFSIRNADGSHREDTGNMTLLNDDAARDFGNAVIEDMLPGNPDRHTGCTMDVTEGERFVCCIAFS